MDTTFLSNFIEVIERGSIAEVARKNGLTPAAVNQRIKKIEDELGFRLVVRAGRTVKPTAEGAHVLAQAKLVMESVRNLKAASQGPLVFGHISLGAFDSAMTTTVPALLPRLVERFPNLEISLVKGYSMNLYGKVCDGELDAALMLQPQFQLPKNIEWRHLRDEPLVVLAPLDIKETDPNQVLRGNPLICYDRHLWGGQLAASYFRQHSIHPKVRIEVASIEVIALLVSKGLGVSLVPDWAGGLLHSLPLQKIPLAGQEHFRSVGLCWNRQSVRAALIEEIFQLASAV